MEAAAHFFRVLDVFRDILCPAFCMSGIVISLDWDQAVSVRAVHHSRAKHDTQTSSHHGRLSLRHKGVLKRTNQPRPISAFRNPMSHP